MEPGALDHVAIVVADLAQSEREYALLGFSVLYRERIEEQGVDIVGMRAGASSIELLKPLDARSPLQRFLGNQRSKLHHLAYRVGDLEAEIRRLLAAGVPLIDTTPRRGARGNRIAFIHPSYSGGTLIELCEPTPV
jgi:methylmalonyl-CoA/ethylmalonyl-CoA epimerase